MKKKEQKAILVYLGSNKLSMPKNLRLTQKIYRDGWNTAIEKVIQHIQNQRISKEETWENTA